MQTKGRPQSSNIEDRRTEAGPMTQAQRNTASFKTQSFKAAQSPDLGHPWNKFQAGPLPAYINDGPPAMTITGSSIIHNQPVQGSSKGIKKEK